MYATILVGTDGSAAAHRAVRAAGELARRTDAHTVHVVAGYHPISSGELQHLAHQIPSEFRDILSSDGPGVSLIEDATAELHTMGVQAKGYPVPDSGSHAILDVADEIDADVIVVGASGHGVGRQLLLGSVSTKVVHHAKCDVLIVRNDGAGST